jgi:hypothetical protein
MALSAEERSARAKLAVHCGWAKNGSAATAAKHQREAELARAKFLELQAQRLAAAARSAADKADRYADEIGA